MTLPGDHNGRILVDTRKETYGNLHTPHTGEPLPGQPFATGVPITVEKRPESTVLPTVVPSGFSAQPNELGMDSDLTHLEASPRPDAGLGRVVHDDEQKSAAFDQGFCDANFSHLDTAKGKVSETLLCDSEDSKRQRNCEEAILSGTLQEQIDQVWRMMKASEGGGKRNSQAAVVSFPSKFVENLCEQNIQLFLRCEQYRHSKMQLNEMIARLEGELRDAIRKCTQLGSDVEAQKKQRAESLRIR